MSYQATPNDKWTLLTIDDPDYLSGKSISNIIKLISKLINIEFIVVSNLSIGGYNEKLGNAGEIISQNHPYFNLNNKATDAIHFSLNDKPSLQEFMNARSYLEQNQNGILDIKKILCVIDKIQQFDWGDFFLFKDYPTNWEDDATQYPDAISQTDITIRAIDDQYIDVYTPNAEIVGLIKKNYILHNIKTGLLTDFIYPD